MKTFLKLFSVFMVAVLLLTGCNTAGDSTDTLNTDHNTDPLESVNESETEPQKKDTSYQIIYPQGATS